MLFVEMLCVIMLWLTILATMLMSNEQKPNSAKIHLNWFVCGVVELGFGCDYVAIDSLAVQSGMGLFGLDFHLECKFKGYEEHPMCSNLSDHYEYGMAW